MGARSRVISFFLTYMPAIIEIEKEGYVQGVREGKITSLVLDIFETLWDIHRKIF